MLFSPPCFPFAIDFVFRPYGMIPSLLSQGCYGDGRLYIYICTYWEFFQCVFFPPSSAFFCRFSYAEDAAIVLALRAEVFSCVFISRLIL